MTLEQLLLQLGLNVSSAFVYDVAKNYFQKEKSPTLNGLKAELSSHLNIEDADIKSGNIVDFLAENGDITISGTQIYASKSITMASTQGTQFTFGNNSESTTSKSSIKAGRGAQIRGRGGARVEQNEDGNINFYA